MEKLNEKRDSVLCTAFEIGKYFKRDYSKIKE